MEGPTVITCPRRRPEATPTIASRSAAWLPGLRRLCAYRIGWLRGDGQADLTVAAYLVPQCMAYGELAGLPPVQGLWAILPPPAVMTAPVITPMAAGDPRAYGIVFNLARVKQDLYRQLSRAGLVERIGADRFFPTLPTAVAEFTTRTDAGTPRKPGP
jgi:MFS superfamily sulfate permease-like transporter